MGEVDLSKELFENIKKVCFRYTDFYHCVKLEDIQSAINKTIDEQIKRMIYDDYLNGSYGRAENIYINETVEEI